MTHIEDKLASYPVNLELRLRAVRTLIQNIAKTTETIGTIEESLKWGQICLGNL